MAVAHLRTAAPARSLAAVLVATSLAGCNTLDALDLVDHVRGSGRVVEEEREVESFTQLSVGGAIEAIVTIGDEVAVTVRSDDNIVERLETVVEGETLLVRPEGGNVGFDPTDGIQVTITVPALEGIEASGAASVAVGPLEGEALSVEASGASHVVVDEAAVAAITLDASGASEISVGGGTASSLVADLSGAASLDAHDLIAQRVVFDGSGAAHGQVHAEDALEASLSGGSSLCYAGEPADLTQEVSGGGSLEPCL